MGADRPKFEYEIGSTAALLFKEFKGLDVEPFVKISGDISRFSNNMIADLDEDSDNLLN